MGDTVCPARPRTHLHDQLATTEVAASGPVKPLPVAPPLMLCSREREQVARTASERRAGNSVPAPALRLMLHGVFSVPRTRYALNSRENLARVTTVTSFLQTGTLRHRRLHTRPAGAQPRSAADDRLTAVSHGSGSSAREKGQRRSHPQGPGVCRWPVVFTPACGSVLRPAGWAACGNVRRGGSRRYHITSPSAKKQRCPIVRSSSPDGGAAASWWPSRLRGHVSSLHHPSSRGGARREKTVTSPQAPKTHQAPQAGAPPRRPRKHVCVYVHEQAQTRADTHKHTRGRVTQPHTQTRGSRQPTQPRVHTPTHTRVRPRMGLQSPSACVACVTCTRAPWGSGATEQATNDPSSAGPIQPVGGGPWGLTGTKPRWTDTPLTRKMNCGHTVLSPLAKMPPKGAVGCPSHQAPCQALPRGASACLHNLPSKPARRSAPFPWGPKLQHGTGPSRRKRSSICPDFSTAHAAPGDRSTIRLPEDCPLPSPVACHRAPVAPHPQPRLSAAVSLPAELLGLTCKGLRTSPPPALPLAPPRRLPSSQQPLLLAQHPRTSMLLGTPGQAS